MANGVGGSECTTTVISVVPQPDITVVTAESQQVTVVSVAPQPDITVVSDNARIGPVGPQGPVGNLVFVSEDSASAITANLLNFVNTATITVDIVQNGMNAEIAFTAVGGAAFDQANAAYDQANAAFDAANTANVNALTAYDQANAAYTAANNAKVTVYANSDSNVTTQVINFINTASVLVDVIADGSNANVSFLAVGGPAYDQANAAYAQANAAYDAANNARVTVFANNASNVTTQNINFVNTSTVSVTVSPDASNANVQLDLTELQYSTNTTSAEVVDLWSASNYRSGKYHMQVENFLGFFATDLMIIHDGNATNLTLFGETSFGSNTGIFTSDLYSGFVRLLFTPNDSTTNLTFTRKLLQNRAFEPLPTDLMLGINTYDLMNILYINPTDLNA